MLFRYFCIGIDKKEHPRKDTLFYVELLFSCSVVNNLFAFVVAASRAYMMRHHCFVALRAFYVARCGQFPVCATHLLTSLG